MIYIKLFFLTFIGLTFSFFITTKWSESGNYSAKLLASIIVAFFTSLAASAFTFLISWLFSK